MTWTFVGRVEELQTLRRAVRCGAPGPVIITGEPGSGRSAVLARALEFADPERDVVVRLPSDAKHPLAALHESLPDQWLPGSVTPEAIRAVSDRADGRRLVIAADDAHLLDQASLLAMREISRQGGALLLVTCPKMPPVPGKPDPSDCLRYEKGTKRLVLQPLSIGEVAAVLAAVLEGPVTLSTAAAIHVVTGGNPRLLRTLVTETQLAECVVRRDGQWCVSMADTDPGQAGQATPDRLVSQEDRRETRFDPGRVTDATWSAWRDLAFERADQLCRLAFRYGAHEEVAPIWATLLLLRGRAQEALTFIRSLPSERVATVPRLAMAMTMVLAVGLGRVDEASELLSQIADHTDARQLTLAQRAWILAITGRPAQARATLRAVHRSDLETSMFVHATRGALTRIADRSGEAVFNFRRALATAESGSNDYPWMRPLLTASLIDSLLLSGRVQDAASIAKRFHAREPGSGWEFAVALDALMTSGLDSYPAVQRSGLASA